ncbi:MAG TPA: HPr family phosphocarrier protein [Burkholderiales bacterium]|nr:HPr family phosphocarrier protein [Burkholderiales bacterium]HUP09770.1 HPr family phosphocarrier protein [Caldimonas sp.]
MSLAGDPKDPAVTKRPGTKSTSPEPILIGAATPLKGVPMQVREVTIVNRLGLHARAAVKLVSLCSKYVSNVVIAVNGRQASGRQLIAIMLLSASLGAKVSLQVSGPDENEAMAAVARLISNGFGEG